MKLYLIFTVFLLSSLHSYEVEGIRLGKVTLPVSSHQDIIKMLWVKGSNDQEHDNLLAKIDEVPSGSNRKLMRTITSSSTTTTVSKNQKPDGNKPDPKQEIRSVHGSVGEDDNDIFSLLPENSEHEKEVASETYPNDTDMMDYHSARNKPPIHN